jgi:hypothetical protein
MKKVCLLISAALFSATCFADTITLKNGQAIQCQVVGFEKSKLTAVVMGETRVFKISTVDAFQIGQAQDPAPVDGEAILLGQAEVGQHGFFNVTLKVVTAEEGRFIGATKRHAVIVQGVDTTGLVTGRWVRLDQRLKVAGTESASDGQTLFVLEPFQPEQTAVKRDEDPALSRPASGPLRVRDIRD